MRNGQILGLFLAGVAIMLAAGLALGQGPATPGPTKPPPGDARPKTDIVANPTVDQCRAGWNPSLTWTKEQFESFCAKLKAAK
jgi:hypothetical protein